MRPEWIPPFVEELAKLSAAGVAHTHREARKQLQPGDIINMTPYGAEEKGPLWGRGRERWKRKMLKEKT